MATKPYPKMEEKPTVAYSSAASVYSVKHKPTPYEMEILRRSEEDSNAGRV